MTRQLPPTVQRATVVIPAFNCADLLDRQLQAVHEQVCPIPWDVVVGDNGSTDHLASVVEGWQTRGLDVSVIDASARRGPAAARNLAAAAATGDALVFTDADDQVAPGWLAASVAALADHDVVAGALDYRLLNDLGESVGQNPSPLQFNFLPAGLGANLAVRRSAFEAVDGFSEELTVGEDIDMCWRLQQLGFRFGYAADSLVHKSERLTAAEQRRQSFAYGRGDPLLFRRHRGNGMPHTPWLTLKTWVWLIVNVVSIGSATGRARWSRVLFLRLGRLVGSVEQRVVYL
jgi:glycosyltransferase involved in cell wall biosynthesis